MADASVVDPRGRRATDPVRDMGPGESELQVDELLEYMVRTEASDLHLSCGVQPVARVDGELNPIPGTSVLTPQMTSAFLDKIASKAQRATFDAEWELDFAFGRRGLGRYRVNAFTEKGDVAVAIRRIPDLPPSLEELGLPDVLSELCKLRRGLILITGPTGAGKTTTLAAMISRINRDRTDHIITIEDPIEFIHHHNRSIVQQREVGKDTTEFARALRSALREDPDVILIGEMRDLETIAAAVSAAETGHLVFATLHTNSAAQAVDRIIDVFPPDQQTQIRMQLSVSLEAVLAQRLVPKVVGGRVAVVEVLIATDAVRNIIREGRTHQIETAMQSGMRQGMVQFDMVLSDLVRRGEVDREVAHRYSNDPRSFESRMSAAPPQY